MLDRSLIRYDQKIDEYGFYYDSVLRLKRIISLNLHWGLQVKNGGREYHCTSSPYSEKQAKCAFFVGAFVCIDLRDAVGKSNLAAGSCWITCRLPTTKKAYDSWIIGNMYKSIWVYKL